MSQSYFHWKRLTDSYARRSIFMGRRRRNPTFTGSGSPIGSQSLRPLVCCRRNPTFTGSGSPMLSEAMYYAKKNKCRNPTFTGSGSPMNKYRKAARVNVFGSQSYFHWKRLTDRFEHFNKGFIIWVAILLSLEAAHR